MVLKVVTCKILETLELRWCPTGRSSVLELRQEMRREGFRLGDDRSLQPGSCAHGQIVKERDYLVDNLCLSMLSQLEHEVNGKAVGLLIRFPFWECRSRLIHKGVGTARAAAVSFGDGNRVLASHAIIVGEISQRQASCRNCGKMQSMAGLRT
jgi:hypothetical protein